RRTRTPTRSTQCCTCPCESCCSTTCTERSTGPSRRVRRGCLPMPRFLPTDRSSAPSSSSSSSATPCGARRPPCCDTCSAWRSIWRWASTTYDHSRMTPDDFRAAGHTLVDWVADYLERVAEMPVSPAIEPGWVRAQLPSNPPEHGEPWDEIVDDLDRV